jgi:hypothetical protein
MAGDGTEVERATQRYIDAAFAELGLNSSVRDRQTVVDAYVRKRCLLDGQSDRRVAAISLRAAYGAVVAELRWRARTRKGGG